MNRFLDKFLISSFSLVPVLGLFLICTMSSVVCAEAKSSKKNSLKDGKKVFQVKSFPKVPEQTKRGVDARAVYCVNLTDNETLMARNPDRQLPVASLTKLVTALVVLDHMPLNKKVKLPSRLPKTPKSVIGLKPEDELTVNDLLHGLLMGSANDCAEVLATAFPKGRDRFIAQMNKKARSLGAKKTVFYTPSGLDKKMAVKTKVSMGKSKINTRSNVSTAREIAHIAQVAFSNRTIRDICLKKRYVMASAEQKGGYPVKNTNKLLRENLPVTGGKTGFTNRAGHCLVTKFAPGKEKLLIVVLGSRDHFKDTRLVYDKVRQLGKTSKKSIHGSVSRGKAPRFYPLGG